MSETRDEQSAHLVARWRGGDHGAARELFERYTNRLIALARSRIPGKFSGRIDAEDIVQSVYRSFFASAGSGGVQLQRGGDLWRLLVTITLNKLYDQVERNTARKRAVGQERALGNDGCLTERLLTHEPSPLEAVAVAEELERIMGRLTPDQRHILSLRLQGHKLTQIASLARCSERTVRRVLELVKEQFEPSPGC